jgi:hypothetical protein
VQFGEDRPKGFEAVVRVVGCAEWQREVAEKTKKNERREQGRVQ